MTDREKAIVMAYTGIVMLKGEKINEYYKYLEELYGRPVYTHEIVTLDIAERAKPDFIRLCEESESITFRELGKAFNAGLAEGIKKVLGTNVGDMISRQAAIDAFYKFSSDGDFVDACEYVLRNVPSTEPEIITCENCKYGSGKPIADGRRWCSRHYDYMYYCSDSEVKNDEIS